MKNLIKELMEGITDRLSKEPKVMTWLEVNFKALKIVIQWGVIFISYFLVFFLPLYWLFCFNNPSQFSGALTPLCVLLSVFLSRYFGRKLIKAKFPHLDSSRDD